MKSISKKKNKLIFGIACLFLIVFSGCSERRPPNVLDEDKMVSLMVDMQLAEAYATQFSSSRNDIKMELGKRVLAKHGVSEETLDTTLAWYGRNLDEYTELFEKIDKEILNKRRQFSETSVEYSAQENNLWPYPRHLVVSPLSANDGVIFSIENPGVQKGEVVRMTFALPNAASGKGTLGVEYEDGTGETILNSFNAKKRYEIELQSDTAKKIARLYGFTIFKERNTFPIYIDSVALTVHPIDSTEYRQKRRSQKKYGAPKERERIIISKDTVKNDSISDQVILNPTN